MLSVANSCDNNENSKNGKGPRVGAKFSVQILGAAGDGGWLCKN